MNKELDEKVKRIAKWILYGATLYRVYQTFLSDNAQHDKAIAVIFEAIRIIHAF